MKPRDFLRKEKIAVLCGGNSVEREISLKTGAAVYNALKKAGYDVQLTDVDNDVFSKLKELKINYVFIAMHGKNGEDGTIQGGLEIMGIKYTGCGVLASACTMDKHFTKKIFKYAGIPTPGWLLFNKDNFKETMNNFNFPAIIKPRFSGSAIGVEIIKTRDNFIEIYNSVEKYSKDFLLEEYIDGTEITIGFLGNKILPIIEIVPENEFYDYKSKYIIGKSKHIIPARINKAIADEAIKITQKCIKEFELKVMSRIDMKISSKNNLYVLEINTIPGLTETSLFPDACTYSKINFLEMILLMFDHSFE